MRCVAQTRVSTLEQELKRLQQHFEAEKRRADDAEASSNHAYRSQMAKLTDSNATQTAEITRMREEARKIVEENKVREMTGIPQLLSRRFPVSLCCCPHCDHRRCTTGS